MSQLKALLSKRVGGVPVTAVLLVLAVIALFAASRMAPSDGGADLEPEGDSSGDVTEASNPVFVARKDGTLGQGDGDVFEEFDTDAWRMGAVAWLMTQGYSPTFAQTVVDKYLNGDERSQEEDRVLQLLLKAKGLPPRLPDTIGGVTPAPVPAPVKPGGTVSPTPLPTVKPPKYKQVIISARAGDTPHKVAAIHHMGLTRFRFLNPSLAHVAASYKIPRGKKLRVDVPTNVGPKS